MGKNYVHFQHATFLLADDACVRTRAKHKKLYANVVFLLTMWLEPTMTYRSAAVKEYTFQIWMSAEFESQFPLVLLS